MANFQNAFRKTMQNEGGFVLHKEKHDRGGWTFAGIAEKYHADWPGWPLVKVGQTNGDKVTKLVEDFYKVKFWNIARLNNVNSDIVAYNIFDFGVNAGMGTAVRKAQAIVGTEVDGDLGPITLAAINAFDERLFVDAFYNERVSYYRAIVAYNSSQKKFLKGWINRADRTKLGKYS